MTTETIVPIRSNTAELIRAAGRVFGWTDATPAKATDTIKVTKGELTVFVFLTTCGQVSTARAYKGDTTKINNITWTVERGTAHRRPQVITFLALEG